MTSLSLAHVLRAQQFNKKLIGQVFDVVEAMEQVVARGGSQELRGKIMGTLFYTVSTRTRLSFEAAMQRLGGGVISTEHPQSFSDFSGTTASPANGPAGLFEDTIGMVNQYADLIVLRHPEEGFADRAAAVSSVPVINAGGGGQHPTQALLDLYTIYRAIDGIDGVSVVLMGDMAHSDTSRSLCYFLAKYSGVKLWLVSPKKLAMGEDILDYLEKHEVRHRELHSPGPELDEALQAADVVYQTDLPQQFEPGGGAPSRRAFRIDGAMLRTIRQKAIIMHPFPRVDSISPEVDADPRAHYFQQITNGLYVRMALLQMLLAG